MDTQSDAYAFVKFLFVPCGVILFFFVLLIPFGWFDLWFNVAQVIAFLNVALLAIWDIRRNWLWKPNTN